jgi:hypothetical protein
MTEDDAGFYVTTTAAKTTSHKDLKNRVRKVMMK